ncbi:hypothetical protein ACLOJK_004678 [Asimina triloba]
MESQERLHHPKLEGNSNSDPQHRLVQTNVPGTIVPGRLIRFWGRQEDASWDVVVIPDYHNLLRRNYSFLLHPKLEWGSDCTTRKAVETEWFGCD